MIKNITLFYLNLFGLDDKTDYNIRQLRNLEKKYYGIFPDNVFKYSENLNDLSPEQNIIICKIENKSSLYKFIQQLLFTDNKNIQIILQFSNIDYIDMDIIKTLFNHIDNIDNNSFYLSECINIEKYKKYDIYQDLSNILKYRL